MGHRQIITRLVMGPPRRTAIVAGTVVVALSAGWVVALFIAGGPSHLNPGVLLVPVVVAGFYFGPLAGVVVAAAAGLAIGPWMEASPGVPQPPSDWAIRIAAYAAAGGVVGALSLRQHRLTQRALEGQQRLLLATPDIIERERLKALREMSSGVVHDFNNTLAPIVGFSDLLLLPEVSRDPEAVRRYAEAINKAGADAAAVVARLRQFYVNGDAGRPLMPVNLAQVVDQSLSMTEARWKSQARAAGATIETEIDCPEDLAAMSNDAELRGVLTNLIFNAVDAMPNGGRLSFTARRTDGETVLSIADTGTGMDPQTLRKATEPYFTTKAGGTGLGMAIVASIMRSHGGRMEVSSAVGEGTRVDLVFPVLEPRDVQAPTDAGPALEVGTLRVLLAEDDPLVRAMLQEILNMEGHHVTAAGDGKEAIRIFREAPQEFDLVMSDAAMPMLSGRAMLLEMRRVRADIPFVMLSGFDPNPLEPQATAPEADEPRTVVLSKPAGLRELRRALWQATQPAGPAPKE